MLKFATHFLVSRMNFTFLFPLKVYLNYMNLILKHLPFWLIKLFIRGTSYSCTSELLRKLNIRIGVSWVLNIQFPADLIPDETCQIHHVRLKASIIHKI